MKPITHVYGVVRESIQADAASLAPRLRQQDKDELRYYRNAAPLEALENSIDNAKISLSFVKHQGDVEAMFGVGWTQNPRVGLVWLLTSDFIYEMQYEFLKETKRYIDVFSVGHDLLANHVHAKNTLSINWLKRNSFEETTHYDGIGDHRETFIEFCYYTTPEARQIYLDRTWPHSC